MLPLALSFLLAVTPADTTMNREACIDMLPVTSSSDLPVQSLAEAQETWIGERTVPTDTLRTYIDQLRAAYQCFQSLPPSEPHEPYVNVLYILRWEALLHTSLGQISDAFEALSAGHDRLSKTFPGVNVDSVRDEWRPELYHHQGYLHYINGNLSVAIESYLKALRRTPEESYSDRAQRLLDIGILHQRTQDYRSARQYYQQAEQLLPEVDSPADAPRQKGRAWFFQAELLVERTMNTTYNRTALQEARTLLRQARRATERETKLYGNISLLLSETLGYLSSFGEAYRLNRAVLDFAEANGFPKLRTFTLYKRGILHLQTQKWKQADSLLQQSLSRAEEIEHLDYQRRILRDLGRLHELQHEWRAAETYYRQGIAVIETYRASLTASEWSMTAFSEWQDVHRGLVRALLAQNRKRDALLALDRTRARHLRDLRTQARIANDLAPETKARFDSLTHALETVRTQLGTQGLASKHRALRHREAELMASRRNLLDIRSDPDRPSLDAISTQLRDRDRALVSYFLDAPWPIYDRSSRSTAFVLTADTLRTVSLSGVTQDSVRALTNRISPLFRASGRARSSNGMHFDLQPLYVLQKALYAPVAESLPPGRPLTVVPDGPLFRVPYSTLVRGMPGGRYAPAEARYVLHERAVDLELSTSLAAAHTGPASPQSSEAPRVSAFGVSNFDTPHMASRLLDSLLPEPAPDSASLPSLPGVRSELTAIQHAIDEASVALNASATKSAFKTACRRGDILHIASHAFVHPSSPLQNSIVLHPDSSSEGILFLHELPIQERPIPLVVLSGCNTARGPLHNGEGMAGLQYAFRAVGARSTVSNVWPVADRASVDLMDTFYRQLREGRSKDEALRRAKLTFLEEHPAKASPFFWAPAVLYGSPEPLPLPSRSLPPWVRWMGGLAALLLLGLGIRWGRRSEWIRGVVRWPSAAP